MRDFSLVIDRSFDNNASAHNTLEINIENCDFHLSVMSSECPCALRFGSMLIA